MEIKKANYTGAQDLKYLSFKVLKHLKFSLIFILVIDANLS